MAELKRWDGTTWQTVNQSQFKRWDGTTWQTSNLHYSNGSQWLPVWADISPAFIEATTHYSNTSASNANGLNLIQEGDLLLLFLAWQDSTKTPTIGGGWTSLGRGDDNTLATQVLWKTATASDVGGSYSLDFGSVTQHTAIIAGYRDLIISAEFSTAPETGASTDTIHTAPSLTTTEDSWILRFVADRATTSGSSTSITDPAGVTRRAVYIRPVSTVAASSAVLADSNAVVAASLQPAEDFTFDIGSQNAAGWTIALLPSETGTPVVATARDPLLWPYPPESFWNMPIGDDATLVSLNMAPIGTHFAFRWEEEIMTLDPDAPERTIMEHDAGWSGDLRRESLTGNALTGNGTVSDVTVPIPDDFLTDPGGLPNGYLGTTPNHSSAHVYRDGSDIKILECQPTHIFKNELDETVAISQYVNSNWVGDSIITGGDGTKGGAHGGSYMTAFGGTIRVGEWVPGGEIPHATKIVLNTAKLCYNHDTQNECFTWPASRADSTAATTYGDEADPSLPPEAVMGMLLTLPAAFDTEALTTEPARILARSIKNYGTYLVDGDHGLDVAMFAVEWSNQGRVLNDFGADFGIKGFHRPVDGAMPQAQIDFLADMNSVYEAFVIVTDNSSSSPGGAGATRRAPIAPPLKDGPY